MSLMTISLSELLITLLPLTARNMRAFYYPN